MIKISKRLLSLTYYLNSDDKIMDVGCDHAILDIYLVQTGLVNKIVVCDVNSNALQNGIENIRKYGLEKNIMPVLSYGIEKINEFDINTLVISGMGSSNIIDILSSPNLNKVYKLVLQSNNNHYELRKFLMSKGFTILDEKIVPDGKKTYINIVAVRTYKLPSYSESELEFGPILSKNKENLEYFSNQLENLKSLLFKSNSDEIREKIGYLEEIVNSLED